MDPISERLARKYRRKVIFTYVVLAITVAFQLGYSALRHESVWLAMVFVVITVGSNLFLFRKKLFGKK